MRKSIIISALLALITITSVRADEGMWLPLLIERLNQRDLQKMGLQLTPEEIYSVNKSSLKDAIVSMGGFCTGEIISPNGLMLTNHHCGYDAIRENSTVEADYLTNGFWAKSYAEELTNEGLYVSFLVRMEDVTEEMLAAVEGAESEDERNQIISAKGKELAAAATQDSHYNARVSSFYAGNEFYLFVYETFTDVRLVGAPPSSVGKYGGDTDNWMWPRQTGDFSMFRVYSGPDGKPADYSQDNIPLSPKHFLPVSIAGLEEGDFTMTAGYPGSTDRYLTSFGIQQALDLKNPTIVEIRDAKLAALREDMKQDDAVRLMYASKYAQIANYWKYFIGQTEQLKANNVKEAKEELEANFQNWADSDPARKAKYGMALDMIEKAYAMTDKNVIGGTYVLEGGLLGADVNLFAYRMGSQIDGYLQMEEGEEKEEMKKGLMAYAEEFFEGANMSTDKKLFAVTHELYSKNVPADQQPEYMKDLNGKMDGKWMKYADKVYSKSIFTDKERMMKFLTDPSQKTYDKDPMKAISADLFAIYRGRAEQNAEANEMLVKGNRLFIAGLREMNPDKEFYPDANSTMRLSFGNVADYEPKDGVTYNYFTTLEGVMEKMDPDDDEFQVPAKLVELYKAKDYGQYADKNGDLVVNFISTNDITGGNSGSPVINGNGELVGLAFDGNWEAMSGDINFEKSIQRTISVDIRYVLFMVDKFAGATNLIDEMTLVKTKAKPAMEAAKAPMNSEVEKVEMN
ncbi:S46 family peptidase [Cryomorphaceae bacterium 1068]|nr:S46 family peptidase [Cryomorphaceae bacterium 1068]